MKLIQGWPNEKIWIYLWWAVIELLDAYIVCPWGLCGASPNVMRLMSASKINLITICKCYSCFPNRAGLTLEACIYIHTHEPKTKLNADTCAPHVETLTCNVILMLHYKWLMCIRANVIREKKKKQISFSCPAHSSSCVFTFLWIICSTL